jgi:hypothetical protein
VYISQMSQHCNLQGFGHHNSSVHKQNCDVYVLRQRDYFGFKMDVREGICECVDWLRMETNERLMLLKCKELTPCTLNLLLRSSW